MNKNKTGFFDTIWPKLNTKKDSIATLRNCQIISFYLAASYLLNFYFIYSYGESLWTTEATGSFDGLFFLFFTALFVWLGFRIRQNKFGSVPYISAWCIIECILTTMYAPQGLVIRLIAAAISVSCLRAWFFQRKFK